MVSPLLHYLVNGQCVAWWVWDGNLEYIVRDDVAYSDSKILMDAWEARKEYLLFKIRATS